MPLVALFFIIGVLLRLMGCGANVGCNVSFVGVDSLFEYVIMVCVWSMSKGGEFCAEEWWGWKEGVFGV